VITTAAVLLLVTAVWSAIVWPPFLRRVIRDPRSRGADGRATRFLGVHIVLVSISLAIAAACLIAAIAIFAGQR
jgi:hypothetical protein